MNDDIYIKPLKEIKKNDYVNEENKEIMTKKNNLE